MLSRKIRQPKTTICSNCTFVSRMGKLDRLFARVICVPTNRPFSQGHVVMGTQAVSPYQQVIEKTKGLAFRSQMLVMNIEKKLGALNKDVSVSFPHLGLLGGSIGIFLFLNFHFGCHN